MGHTNRRSGEKIGRNLIKRLIRCGYEVAPSRVGQRSWGGNNIDRKMDGLKFGKRNNSHSVGRYSCQYNY